MTNQQDKAQFFAQYWGQNVVYNNLFKFNDLISVCGASFTVEALPNLTLHLKPLESISDEDCRELIAMIWGNDYSKDFIINKNDKDWVRVYEPESDIELKIFHLGGLQHSDSGEQDLCASTSLKMYDFLRSRSYALPFRQYSVQDQQSLGWVKLKAGK